MPLRHPFTFRTYFQAVLSVLLLTLVSLPSFSQVVVWDWTSGPPANYKQSAQTIERGKDGYIIYQYRSGNVYFGVYERMMSTPSVATSTFTGVYISSGSVAYFGENISPIFGVTTVAANDYIRMERVGSKLVLSKGTASTGPWTAFLTRTADANKDWHPIMKDDSGTHSTVVTQISPTAVREGYQPDYWGSTIDLGSTYTNTYFPRYDETNYSTTYNWQYSVTYNGEGEKPCHELGQSITYYDDLGRAIQSQAKDYTSDKVWVTQTVFDRYGRAAISTLPAPKSTTQMGYVDKFARSGQTTSNAYSSTDFDASTTYFNPKIVGNVAGTLGAWYYNTDGTDDPGRPATQYPFSRTEFSPLTGGARYATAPGEDFRLRATDFSTTGASTGHYGRSFSMSAGNELTYLFGQRNPLALLSGTVYDDNNTLSSYTNTAVTAQYFKTVSVDADGKQAVTFTDVEGREVARCLSGMVNGANVKTQTTTLAIPPGEYRDIHITDQAATTSVTLSGTSMKYTIYRLETYHDFNKTTTNPTNPATPAGAIVINGTTTSRSLAPGFYRIANTSTAASPPTITVSYDLNYHNFTLNIYDLAGRLAATVPPNTVRYNTVPNNPAPPSYILPTDVRSEFSYYRYNSLGQLLWDQTPDGGRTDYYYRKDGQIRFSQNAKQVAESRYSYTNYFANGRPQESGEAYKSGVTTTILANGVDATALPSSSTKKVLVLTKYDVPNATPSGWTQKNMVGRVSYVEKKEEIASTLTITSKNWYSYDELGRAAWTGEWTAGIGNKFMEYTYDLLGNVTKTVYQGKGSATDELHHMYAYNNEGQLQHASVRKNALATTLPRKVADYAYYKTGGGLKSVTYDEGFKSFAYSYTLHGQLKGINLADMGTAYNAYPSVFAMALDYYTNDFRTTMATTPAAPTESPVNNTVYGYSGNIARQQWKAPDALVGAANFKGTFAYTYTYNHRSELTGGQFAEGGTGGTPYTLTYDPNHKYREYGMTYDLNGNLLTLDRYGATPGTVRENYAYSYNANKNQLNSLSGTFQTLPGYLKMQSANNYMYDAIGQLTDDVVENLRQVYDVYGKVVQVTDRATPTPNLKVQYWYNAGGMRIKKTAYSNATNYTSTYYSYAGSNLAAIYTETVTNGTSGGILHTESPMYGAGRVGTAYLTSGAIESYVYEVRDHLGNVRVTFRRQCLSCREENLLFIESYADYYPYGWVLPGRNGNNGTAYRYGFQGEFAEKDAETGWNAFELRMYESRLGRWMATDPYDQYWSPYIGMGNNPINGVDPNGGAFNGLKAWIYAQTHGIDKYTLATTSKGDVFMQYSTGDAAASHVVGKLGFFGWVPVHEFSAKVIVGPQLGSDTKYLGTEAGLVVGHGHVLLDANFYEESTYFDPYGFIFGGSWEESATLEKPYVYAPTALNEAYGKGQTTFDVETSLGIYQSREKAVNGQRIQEKIGLGLGDRKAFFLIGYDIDYFFGLVKKY